MAQAIQGLERVPWWVAVPILALVVIGGVCYMLWEERRDFERKDPPK